MFYGCKNFNSNISEWNVSNVENMAYMFRGCKKVNSDMSNWDVSNVQTMNMINMFLECCIPEHYKPKFKN